MQSRHILGCLAERIALSTRRAGFANSNVGSLARTRPSTRKQHSIRHPPAGGSSYRCFAASTPVLSAGVRPPEQFAGSATNDASASQSLTEHVRHLLRHLADTVVVCTAYSRNDAPAASTAEAEVEAEATAAPVGLTMSSFTSLSLFPTPVVTFNIAVPSRTEAVIATTRHFMIHILAGNERGARLADVFRTGNAHPTGTLRELQRSGCQVVWPPETTETTGPPQDSEQPFLNGPGVLYVLRCRLLDEPLGGLVPVRDHVVVLGEVLDIFQGLEVTADGAGAPRFGLLYGDRLYRQVGSTVTRTGSD